MTGLQLVVPMTWVCPCFVHRHSQAREILRTSTPDLLLLRMDIALTPLTCRAKEKWIQATAAEVLRRLGRPVVSEAPEENTLLDELVMEVASPRTRDLLTDYAEHNKARCTFRCAKILLAAACCSECLCHQGHSVSRPGHTAWHFCACLVPAE